MPSAIAAARSSASYQMKKLRAYDAGGESCIDDGRVQVVPDEHRMLDSRRRGCRFGWRVEVEGVRRILVAGSQHGILPTRLGSRREQTLCEFVSQ